MSVQFIKKLLYTKRKHDWLLGRLTAKELIQKHFFTVYGKRFAFHEIEVLNRPSGRPYFRLINHELPWSALELSLSISHCRGLALCALAEVIPGENLGVDLEYVAPRPDLFAETFYSAAEVSQIEAYSGKDYLTAVTAIWSLKEAFLKALGEGLRVDTHKVVVGLSSPPWSTWKSQIVKMDSHNIKEISARMRCMGLYVLAEVQIKCVSGALAKKVRGK